MYRQKQNYETQVFEHLLEATDLMDFQASVIMDILDDDYVPPVEAMAYYTHQAASLEKRNDLDEAAQQRLQKLKFKVTVTYQILQERLTEIRVSKIIRNGKDDYYDHQLVFKEFDSTSSGKQEDASLVGFFTKADYQNLTRYVEEEKKEKHAEKKKEKHAENTGPKDGNKKQKKDKQKKGPVIEAQNQKEDEDSHGEDGENILDFLNNIEQKYYPKQQQNDEDEEDSGSGSSQNKKVETEEILRMMLNNNSTKATTPAVEEAKKEKEAPPDEELEDEQEMPQVTAKSNNVAFKGVWEYYSGINQDFPRVLDQELEPESYSTVGEKAEKDFGKIKKMRALSAKTKSPELKNRLLKLLDYKMKALFFFLKEQTERYGQDKLEDEDPPDDEESEDEDESEQQKTALQEKLFEIMLRFGKQGEAIESNDAMDKLVQQEKEKERKGQESGKAEQKKKDNEKKKVEAEKNKRKAKGAKKVAANKKPQA